MSEQFIGEIRLLPYNRGVAPEGWAVCDGQMIPIAQNTALFSLIGTTYGGNGQTNFALPDLRGRVPIHAGNGYELGKPGGAKTHTISTPELPSHSHPLLCSSDAGKADSPAGNLPATAPGNVSAEVNSTGRQLNAAVSPSGRSEPHQNMQPYLTLTYCIALQGIFPPRP